MKPTIGLVVFILVLGGYFFYQSPMKSLSQKHISENISDTHKYETIIVEKKEKYSFELQIEEKREIEKVDNSEESDINTYKVISRSTKKHILPKLRLFKIIEEFPTYFLDRIEDRLRKIEHTKSLNQDNMIITMVFNEYIVNNFNELHEDEVVGERLKKTLDALLYHTLLECRYGKHCIGAIFNLTYPISFISKSDMLAWILISKYIRPKDERISNRVNKILATMSTAEKELADYRYNNIMYYLQNPTLPFNEFLEDYWARN